MERIETLLERPGEMTTPQRKLWIENKDLSEGKLDNISSLYVRAHHFTHFRYLISSWFSNELSKGKSPWEFKDSREFQFIVLDVSKHFAFFWLKNYREAINGPEFSQSTIKHARDVIGTTEKEIESYRLSVYLYSVNFLSRAFYNKDQMVFMGEKPDLICGACKGGLNNIGEHCKTTQILDIATAEAFKMLIDTEEYEKIKLVGSDICIPISSFFDSEFAGKLERLASNALDLMDWHH